MSEKPMSSAMMSTMLGRRSAARARTENAQQSATTLRTMRDAMAGLNLISVAKLFASRRGSPAPERAARPGADTALRCEDVSHHVAVHIRQAKIAAVVP